MFNDTVRYLGIIDDPAHLAPASIHEAGHVVALLNLFWAEVVLWSVHNQGRTNRTWDLDVTKQGMDMGMPLSDQATLTLYRVDCRLFDGGPRRAWEKLIKDGDPHPDYIISVGPRGGIKRERC